MLVSGATIYAHNPPRLFIRYHKTSSNMSIANMFLYSRIFFPSATFSVHEEQQLNQCDAIPFLIVLLLFYLIELAKQSSSFRFSSKLQEYLKFKPSNTEYLTPL